MFDAAGHNCCMFFAVTHKCFEGEYFCEKKFLRLDIYDLGHPFMYNGGDNSEWVDLNQFHNMDLNVDMDKRITACKSNRINHKN